MTDKQRKFCLNYAKCGNATKAAIEAGYSERSAYAIASENLRNVEVLNYLEEITGIELEGETTTIQELVRFYFSIMRDESAPLETRLKAADSLSKRCGFSIPTVESCVEDEVLEEIQIKDFLSRIEANATEKT